MNALTALALISRPTATEARDMIDTYKVTTGCIDCGFTGTPAALHFDHRDPSTKYRTRTGRAVHPADMVKAGRDGFPRYSWATILGELAKCDVRCANCHAARTTGQRRTFAEWLTWERAAGAGEERLAYEARVQWGVI